MTTEVTLRVAALDYDDPAVEALIDRFSDYSFATSNSISLVTIFSNGDTITEGTAAVRALRSAGVSVLGVFEDLVNTSEIAERAGISRQGARKWVDREDFPQPQSCIGTDDQRVWTWAHVLTWLNEVKAFPLDEILPTDQTVAAINAYIHGVNGFVYAKNYTALTPAKATGLNSSKRVTSGLGRGWNIKVPTGAAHACGKVASRG
jgi:hypothetical protein